VSRCGLRGSAGYNRNRYAHQIGLPTQTTEAGRGEPILPRSGLRGGSAWAYRLKLDGYWAIAGKTNGRAQLRSQNNRGFNRNAPGRKVSIVAADDSGRSSFNALQNYSTANAPIFRCVFDVLVVAGRSS
jgi:ATP-dependent DNA ligase